MSNTDIEMLTQRWFDPSAQNISFNATIIRGCLKDVTEAKNIEKSFTAIKTVDETNDVYEAVGSNCAKLGAIIDEFPELKVAAFITDEDGDVYIAFSDKGQYTITDALKIGKSSGDYSWESRTIPTQTICNENINIVENGMTTNQYIFPYQTEWDR